MRTNASFSVLTFVLQPHHVTVLSDWLDFFDYPPEELIVHVGQDQRIVSALESACERYGVKIKVLSDISPQDAIQEEPSLLKEQFSCATTELACIVRLDYLPFHAEGIEWQNKALELANHLNARFVTGGALPFRSDLQTTQNRFLLTQRVSNGFLIISPEFWTLAQESDPNSVEKWGRFAPEGCLEDYLKETDQYGIRIINHTDLRVFHVQEWSERLLTVRKAFREGRRIKSHLKGFQDDHQGPNQRYYMHRGLPLSRRLRIWAGKQRRKIFGEHEL